MPIADRNHDRIDLAAQQLYGADTDEGKRNFIRFNIAALSQNPTFWLKEGTTYYGEPFHTVGENYLDIGGGRFLSVGRGLRLRI